MEALWESNNDSRGWTLSLSLPLWAGQQKTSMCFMFLAGVSSSSSPIDPSLFTLSQNYVHVLAKPNPLPVNLHLSLTFLRNSYHTFHEYMIKDHFDPGTSVFFFALKHGRKMETRRCSQQRGNYGPTKHFADLVNIKHSEWDEEMMTSVQFLKIGLDKLWLPS